MITAYTVSGEGALYYVIDLNCVVCNTGDGTD